jgi:hypothetical protein
MTCAIAAADKAGPRRLVSAQMPSLVHKSPIRATPRNEGPGGRIACCRAGSRHSRARRLQSSGEHMKGTKRLLIVLALNIVWGSCWVSSANAGVITLGTWTAMNPSPYWNNLSYDGPGLNVGQLITTWGWPVEYLSGAGGAPVAFAFDQTELSPSELIISSATDPVPAAQRVGSTSQPAGAAVQRAEQYVPRRPRQQCAWEQQRPRFCQNRRPGVCSRAAG